MISDGLLIIASPRWMRCLILRWPARERPQSPRLAAGDHLRRICCLLLDRIVLSSGRDIKVMTAFHFHRRCLCCRSCGVPYTIQRLKIHWSRQTHIPPCLLPATIKKDTLMYHTSFLPRARKDPNLHRLLETSCRSHAWVPHLSS